MQVLTYSWIGILAVSPLIFLVSAWALGVFHSYRRYWRSVDLFLLAIFVQEMLMSLQIFIFSLLSLIKPSAGILCGIFIWSLSATRALEATTVASLLIDRALTSQWPYKYRFSVRRHQIRYHLVVLATMAALVGVAAILARTSGDDADDFSQCHFLPHSLHVRLALFLLSLYGILAVISAVSMCVVQATRGCKGGYLMPIGATDISPLANGTTGSSTTTASSGGIAGGRPLHPAASSASTASSRSGVLASGLHSATSTTDLVSPRIQPNFKRNTKVPPKSRITSLNADFRWAGTLTVSTICFFLNHLPYIGLLVLGTFFPSYLPKWPLENVSLWLSLLQGLFLPLGLGLSDSTFSEAAVWSCGKQRKRPPFQLNGMGVSSPLNMVPKEEVKSFPLTNGSLVSSFLNMNADPPFHGFPFYNRTKASRTDQGLDVFNGGVWGSSEGRAVGSEAHLRRGIGPLTFNPGRTNALSLAQNNYTDPIYSIPLNKAVSRESSLKTVDDDHIYATLSETFGSFSSLSNEYHDEGNRCSSATTVANDDFVYHSPQADLESTNPLTSCLNRIAIQSYTDACNTVLNTNRSIHLNKKSNHLSKTDFSTHFNGQPLKSTPENSVNCNSLTNSSEDGQMTTIINLRASPRLGFVNEAFEGDEYALIKKHDNKELSSNDNQLNGNSNDENRITENTGKLKTAIEISQEKGFVKSLRPSSLSMNDLDRLDANAPEQEDKMLFILPVKSESMLNLYKLYLAEDDASGARNLRYTLEVSKSDNSLNSLQSQNETNTDSNIASQSSSNPGTYKKRRISPLVNRRQIRRHTKIQKSKYLPKRNKPSFLLRKTGSLNSNVDFSKDVTDTPKRTRQSLKNGIITIKDPSVLSVEELLKVLNRASGTSHLNLQRHLQIEEMPKPNTEYKKIFVSEYI